MLPSTQREHLLCAGLQAPWHLVRYAAAMALAELSEDTPLQKETLCRLQSTLSPTEPYAVQLAISHALLRHGEGSSIATLMRLLHGSNAEEARKATAFLLATEPPTQLTATQHEQLTHLLITTLHDPNGEITLYAAHALGILLTEQSLSSLSASLAAKRQHTQIATLIALEETARQDTMRAALQEHPITKNAVLLLHEDTPEVRRQVCYTLAAIGGDYATAVLGTLVLTPMHPAHSEAIEAVRHLVGSSRQRCWLQVVRWLLHALQEEKETIQVTTLDSLASLLWRTRSHSQRQIMHMISDMIHQDGTVQCLLSSQSARVRQQAIELLGRLERQTFTLHQQLLERLHDDDDSGVRACVAHMFGETQARWAIPPLLQAVLDEDEHVAATALNALSALCCPQHTLVLAVVQELAHHDRTSRGEATYLASCAQGILKHWRRSK